MQRVIISEGPFGNVAISYVSPVDVEKYTLEILALQVIPEGKPFWLIDSNKIPEDSTFFDAWELDLKKLGPPDGYGMDSVKWQKEYQKDD